MRLNAEVFSIYTYKLFIGGTVREVCLWVWVHSAQLTQMTGTSITAPGLPKVGTRMLRAPISLHPPGGICTLFLCQNALAFLCKSMARKGSKKGAEGVEGTWGEEEKMKEKWDWSTARIRKSPGKTKEASPGALSRFSQWQKSLLHSPWRFFCYSGLEFGIFERFVFFFFFFGQTSWGRR